MSFSTTVHHTPATAIPSPLGAAAPIDATNTFVQTSATPGLTVAAATSAAVTATGGTAPAGGTGAAAGGWDTAGHRDTAITVINGCVTDIAAIIVDNTALRADVATLRGLVNACIDVLQANGLAG